jgi:alcohol dehydrogenase
VSQKVPSDCEFWVRESGYPKTIEVQEFKMFVEGTRKEFQQVLAIGGGSTLDFSKVISGAMFSDKLEGLFLIPTNIGSGAEITSFATIWDFFSGRKYSEKLPPELRRSVFYDFELMKGVPKDDAIVGALDSLAHAYDSLFSIAGDKRTKEIAIVAIHELNDFLDAGINSWPSEFCISKFQNSAMLAALCIEKTKTSLSHGLSYGLTLHLGIPHGISVALILREYLQEYLYQLSLEISEQTLLRSIDIIHKKLECVLGKYTFPANSKKIEESVDWGRVNNFLPFGDADTYLKLLNRALLRVRSREA